MGFKRLTRASIAVVATVAAVALLPSASFAEQAGSYTTSSGKGTSPRIYYPRMVYTAPVFTAPAETPSEATITSITGRLGFDLKPYGMWWTAWICADAANTQCANVSPAGIFKNDNGWTYSTTASAGWPATTQLHFTWILQDGKTGSIIPALDPPLYSLTRTATVNYTYPDTPTTPDPEPLPDSELGLAS